MVRENIKKADRENYDWKFEKRLTMGFISFLLVVGVVFYRPAEPRAIQAQESETLQALNDIICKIDPDTCAIAQDKNLVFKVWQERTSFLKRPGLTNPYGEYPRQITLSSALFEDTSRLMTIYYHELQHVKESKVAYSDTNRSFAQCLDHNHVRLKTREFADKVDALIKAGELPEYEFDELPSHYAYNDYGNRIEVCTQS